MSKVDIKFKSSNQYNSSNTRVLWNEVKEKLPSIKCSIGFLLILASLVGYGITSGSRTEKKEKDIPEGPPLLKDINKKYKYDASKELKIIAENYPSINSDFSATEDGRIAENKLLSLLGRKFYTSDYEIDEDYLKGELLSLASLEKEKLISLEIKSNTQEDDYWRFMLVSKEPKEILREIAKWYKGKTGKPLYITSGSRDEDYVKYDLSSRNKNASSTGKSAHNTGFTLDIPWELIDEAVLVPLFKKLRDQKLVYVIKEQQQKCYHISFLVQDMEKYKVYLAN